MVRPGNQASRAQLLFVQAGELLERVQSNLTRGRVGDDDLLMKAYNDLASTAVELFPTDSVLGGLVVMPDAVLQSYGTLFSVSSMPRTLPLERLEAHLSRLVNRMSILLGETVPVPKPTKTASEVLRGVRDEAVQKILETIEDLQRRQPELPPIDARDFAFVSDAALRRVLAADYVEAQRSFAVGAFKAAALLVGGLIEGLLLDVLRKPSVVGRNDYQSATASLPNVGGSMNWDKASMSALVRVARELNLIDATIGRMVEGARDFRDPVHPNAEPRPGIRAGREEAELLLALVTLRYRHLFGVQ